MLSIRKALRWQRYKLKNIDLSIRQLIIIIVITNLITLLLSTAIIATAVIAYYRHDTVTQQERKEQAEFDKSVLDQLTILQTNNTALSEKIDNLANLIAETGTDIENTISSRDESITNLQTSVDDVMAKLNEQFPEEEPIIDDSVGTIENTTCPMPAVGDKAVKNLLNRYELGEDHSMFYITIGEDTYNLVDDSEYILSAFNGRFTLSRDAKNYNFYGITEKDPYIDIYNRCVELWGEPYSVEHTENDTQEEWDAAWVMEGDSTDETNYYFTTFGVHYTNLKDDKLQKVVMWCPALPTKSQIINHDDNTTETKEDTTEVSDDKTETKEDAKDTKDDKTEVKEDAKDTKEN